MNRRNKKKNDNKQAARSEPVVSQQILNTSSEEPIRELMFHPLIYKSSSYGDRDIDFEHLVIPFAVKDGLLFLLTFIDGCGDITAYTKCCNMDMEKPSEVYRDAMGLMHTCLEMQRKTGVPYYFGHLDKAVQQYMYGLQMFIEKGFMARKQAVEIVTGLGYAEEDILKNAIEIANQIDETIIRKERILGKNKEREAAEDAMAMFLADLLATSEEADEEEGNSDTEPDAGSAEQA